MPNPLSSVLERHLLYAHVYDYVDGELVTRKSSELFQISLKPINQPGIVIVKQSDDLIRQKYDCWVIAPVITIAELENIRGFGQDAVEYAIIGRDQSALKQINKVFGIRCKVEKLN